MARMLPAIGLWFLGALLPAFAEQLEEGVAAVARRDYAVAFKAFKPLAEAGNVAAQVNLGNLYMKGEGVKQNYVEAGRWYTHAAEQNERMAQSKLGILHYYGLGTEKNPGEAARWFTKAAQQGDRSAQAVLGSLYAQGDGVPQDYAQAYYWYSLAAEQGSEDAEAGRKSLADEMTPGQLDEAMRLLAETRRKAALDAERELESSMSQALPKNSAQQEKTVEGDTGSAGSGGTGSRKRSTGRRKPTKDGDH